ncbi:hypothetical protein Q1695_004652 [Nippostrongylus brasiliensis]|nr:hypothetical protein Q1695_004652 [Nippostrongylus brasiliensis]
MEDEAVRRTFPKKPNNTFVGKNSNSKRFENKPRDASYGGQVLKRKPIRYFKADHSEEYDGPSRKRKGKRKVAAGMKDIKKIKMKKRKEKKLERQRGDPVKGTSIEHKMLGGSDDEMYASEDDDIMDMSDMIKEEQEDNDEPSTVPMITSKSNKTPDAISDIKHEEVDSEHLVARSSTVIRKPKKSAKIKREEGEEEIVEFSTGRGSSRVVFSDDNDEEDRLEENYDVTYKKSREIPSQVTNYSESDSEEDLPEHSGNSNEQHRNGLSFVESREADEEETEEPDVAGFRAEMADLPLGKVRELKEKLGLKLFNKAYFGTRSEDQKAQLMTKEAVEKKEEYRGQHRPKEISSKKPVSVFRPIYQDKKGRKRDPRFDTRAGEFKERCFEDNYQFLDELRKQEREELVKQAAECTERGDAAMANRIREAIRRIDDREKAKAERKLKQQTYHELRQENIDRMMRGERPVFKTKANVKMMQLEKKFNQLKKDNKLENYMKRKAKKEARKEAKKKPSFERQYGYQ